MRHVLNDESEYIHLERTPNGMQIWNAFTGNCPVCNEPISCEIDFYQNPFLVFIEPTTLKLTDLPNETVINNKKIRFLMSTISKPGHFVGVFKLENELYVVDDMGRTMNFMPRYDENKRYADTESLEYMYYIKYVASTAIYYSIDNNI
jgi:hypothetical protein